MLSSAVVLLAVILKYNTEDESPNHVAYNAFIPIVIGCSSLYYKALRLIPEAKARAAKNTAQTAAKEAKKIAAKVEGCLANRSVTTQDIMPSLKKLKQAANTAHTAANEAERQANKAGTAAAKEIHAQAVTAFTQANKALRIAEEAMTRAASELIEVEKQSAEKQLKTIAELEGEIKKLAPDVQINPGKSHEELYADYCHCVLADTSDHNALDTIIQFDLLKRELNQLNQFNHNLKTVIRTKKTQLLGIMLETIKSQNNALINKVLMPFGTQVQTKLDEKNNSILSKLSPYTPTKIEHSKLLLKRQFLVLIRTVSQFLGLIESYKSNVTQNQKTKDQLIVLKRFQTELVELIKSAIGALGQENEALWNHTKAHTKFNGPPNESCPINVPASQTIKDPDFKALIKLTALKYPTDYSLTKPQFNDLLESWVSEDQLLALPQTQWPLQDEKAAATATNSNTI